MSSPTHESDLPVVVITGCSSGLGKALAKVLHDTKRYKVIATARRLESLSDLKSSGIKNCAVLDVTNDTSTTGAVQNILKTNKIDILINNAGLSSVGPLAEQPIDEIQHVFDTNLFGALRVTQAVVQHAMGPQHSGLIINIGSVVSHMATPWAGAYSASKAALLAATDALRLEVAPLNIQVSYVMAGAIASAFGDNTGYNSAFERYESSTSLYTAWSQSIRARANLSQAPGSITAEETARQILRVIDRWNTPHRTRSVPIWFFAGGQAMFFWLIGVIQKTTGWPVNGMLMKKFGLSSTE